MSISFCKKNDAKKKQERGAILVLTALLAPIIFGLALLAMDLGKLYILGTRLQNTANLAALAGARTLADFGDDTTVVQMRTSINLVVLSNKFEHHSAWLGVYKTNTGDLSPETKLDSMVDSTLAKAVYNPTTGVKATVSFSPDGSWLVKAFGFTKSISRTAVAHVCPEGFVMLGGMCPCGNGKYESGPPINEVCDGTATPITSPNLALDCDAGYNHDSPPPPCDYCTTECGKKEKPGRWCGDSITSDNEECDDGKNGKNDDGCQDDCCKPGNVWDPETKRCVIPSACQQLTATFANAGDEPVILRTTQDFQTRIYDSRYANGTKGSLPSVTFCIDRNAKPAFAYTLNSNSRSISLKPGKDCSEPCPGSLCGNGTKDSGEDCDDNNLVDGDNCSATCQCDNGLILINGKCEPEPICTECTNTAPQFPGCSAPSIVVNDQVWAGCNVGATNASETGALTPLNVWKPGVCPSGWHIPTQADWEMAQSSASWNILRDQLRLSKAPLDLNSDGRTWSGPNGDTSFFGVRGRQPIIALGDSGNGFDKFCVHSRTKTQIELYCPENNLNSNYVEYAPPTIVVPSTPIRCVADCPVCPASPGPTLIFEKDATIPAGSSAQLSWSTTNTTSCSPTGGSPDWSSLTISGANVASGSHTTAPLFKDTDFFLQCSGPGGQTEIKKVSITISSPPTSNVCKYNVTSCNASALCNDGDIAVSYSESRSSNQDASVCDWNNGGYLPRQGCLFGKNHNNAKGALAFNVGCLHDPSSNLSPRNLSATWIGTPPNAFRFAPVSSNPAAEADAWMALPNCPNISIPTNSTSNPAINVDACSGDNPGAVDLSMSQLTSRLATGENDSQAQSERIYAGGTSIFLINQLTNAGDLPGNNVKIEYRYSTQQNASIPGGYLPLGAFETVSTITPKSSVQAAHFHTNGNVSSPTTFYIIACADPDNTISEASESNNCSQPAAITITNGAARPAKLSLSGMTSKLASDNSSSIGLQTNTYGENSSIKLITTISNSGGASNGVNLQYRYTMNASQANNIPNGYEPAIIGNESSSSIPESGSTLMTHLHTNGGSSGSDTYYIIACIEGSSTCTPSPAVVIVTKAASIPGVSISGFTRTTHCIVDGRMSSGGCEACETKMYGHPYYPQGCNWVTAQFNSPSTTSTQLMLSGSFTYGAGLNYFVDATFNGMKYPTQQVLHKNIRGNDIAENKFTFNFTRPSKPGTYRAEFTLSSWPDGGHAREVIMGYVDITVD